MVVRTPPDTDLEPVPVQNGPTWNLTTIYYTLTTLAIPGIHCISNLWPPNGPPKIDTAHTYEKKLEKVLQRRQKGLNCLHRRITGDPKIHQELLKHRLLGCPGATGPLFDVLGGPGGGCPLKNNPKYEHTCTQNLPLLRQMRQATQKTKTSKWREFSLPLLLCLVRLHGQNTKSGLHALVNGSISGEPAGRR